MQEASGPYPISEVKFWVRENVPGVFIVGEEPNKPIYIGSSKTDMRQEIEKVAQGRTNFWFEFFASFSQVLLFRLQCKWYHDYYDSLHETDHPKPPINYEGLKCSVCGCQYGQKEFTHSYFR